ncbi:MAG: phosphate ABC transporter ATP-binding protein PstB [Bdellovibrionales bacterium]|nr:phosphate ABC transporter ATP-binding protein PstB [Bdellovibrionales bacterium]
MGVEEAQKNPVLRTDELQAYFGPFHAVKGVSVSIFPNQVIAVIGPSGCGKSTFIRCLNRLHEETPGAKVKGQVWLEGKDIYGKGVDPVLIRRRVGMVFQKPNPFPALSIFDNVAIGPKLMGLRRRALLEEKVEQSLKQAALWNEVKDKLNKLGTSLSGGQQQRLCIARALAINPPVILMDEPTSALDPISTARIEELVQELKNRVTVIMVTHNMQQASRISDKTGFFLLGSMIEYGDTVQVFTKPRDSRTEQYITGRFG